MSVEQPHPKDPLGTAARQHADDDGPTPPLRRAAFDRLMAGYAGSAASTPAQRWQWLEAAHVLGQPLLSLHWRTHAVMLRMAWEQRHWREVMGQCVRLALVPLGHALQRLPVGNTGRADVNLWRAMAPQAPLVTLIEAALAHAQHQQQQQQQQQQAKGL